MARHDVQTTLFEKPDFCRRGTFSSIAAHKNKQEIRHSSCYAVSRAYCNDRYRRAMRGDFLSVRCLSLAFFPVISLFAASQLPPKGNSERRPNPLLSRGRPTTRQQARPE